ncbi:hypothetical protein AMAG_13472 [Allomyces macrogynus ATCC 38327]|uniref:Uncharacterized protein n=1 Tax=Allomyces macrogynus (strain ATCC 38327) TaxID=578462 RepID=A0A0L0T2L0_ALLM3|nr:hypothetical protein AMAG_13472 [Allomyces macrogynus ATCC 38327]|eukprot:KNE68834.1 hypothetical protein AMAG_13472 [Allomyces macrogynus ATCC 38327]
MSAPSSSSRAPPPRRAAAAQPLVAPAGAHPSPNTVMATIMSNPDFFDLFSRPASAASSHGPSLPRSPPLVDVHSAPYPCAPLPSLHHAASSSSSARHSSSTANLDAPGACPSSWMGRARASPSPPPMPLPNSVHPASLVAPRWAAAAAAPLTRPPPAATAAGRASPMPHFPSSRGTPETASMVAVRETALPAESRHNHAIRLVYGPDGRSLVPANHHALPCLDPMILCGRVVDMSVHMEVFLQDLLPRKTSDRADWQPVDITFDILSSRLRQTLEAMESFRADLARRAVQDRESRVAQQVKRLQASRAARSAAKDAGMPSWAASKKGASSSTTKAGRSSYSSSSKLAAPKSAFPSMPSDEDVAAAVSQYVQVPPAWMMLPGGL